MNRNTRTNPITDARRSAGRVRRAAVALWVTCAFVLVAGVASAFAAPAPSYDPNPLPGSTFAAADGNQDAAVPDPGSTATTDWETYKDNSNPQIDQPVSGGGTEDYFFKGHESTPTDWIKDSVSGGITPAKSNALGMWSLTDPISTDVFFYFSFRRASTATSDTFYGVELFHDGHLWRNGNTNTDGTPTEIPCRSNGDLMISYEIDPSHKNVSMNFYEWSAGAGPTNANPLLSCPEGATGAFVPASPAPEAAQAYMNFDAPITNYLSTGDFGSSMPAGLFGEGAVNIDGALGADLSDKPCFSFGAAMLHSRSSASLDSALQDTIDPVPVQVANCKIDVVKTVRVRTAGPSNPATDSGYQDSVDAYTGQTLDYRFDVSVEANSKPLSIRNSDGTVNMQDVVDTGALHDPAAAGATSFCSTPTELKDNIFNSVAYNHGDANHNDLVDPGEHWLVSCSYDVQQSDVNRSPLHNTATVTGQVPSCALELQYCGNQASDDAIATVRSVHLNVDKAQTTVATPAAGDFTHSDIDTYVDQVIHYRLTVTNTSNIALSNVTVTDPNCDGAIRTGLDPASAAIGATVALNAGQSATYYCDHTVLETDPNTFTNEVCVAGSDSGHAATALPPSDKLCDSVDSHPRKPHLAVDKQQTLDANGANMTDSVLTPSVGDTVHYAVTVHNTGNVALDVTTTDVNCDGGSSALSTTFGANTPISTPDPIPAGEPRTYYCDHVVTDGDPATFTNEACAAAADGGHDATPLAGDSLCDHVDINPLRSISGQKFHDLNADGTWDKANEPTLGGWHIEIYKDANADGQFAPGELVDTKTTANVDGGYKFGGLAPGLYKVVEVQDGGAGWHCSAPAGCAYTITITDHSETGKDFGNYKDAVITVVKSTEQSTTRSFSFTSDLAVSEGNPAGGFSLLSGGSKDFTAVTPGASHDSAEDVPEGWFLSKITCVSNLEDGAASRAAVPSDLSKSTTVTYTPISGEHLTCTYDNSRLGPVLEITKAVDKPLAYVGDVLTYTITVQHAAGSQAAAKLTDFKDEINNTGHGCGAIAGPAAGDDANTNGILNLGEVWHFTCTYTVVKAEENANHDIVNAVSASFTNLDGDAQPDIGPATATTHILHPAIAILKTGPATGQAGDKIGYVLTVTNTGDEALKDVVVTDAQCNGDPVTLLSKNGDSTPGTLDLTDVWTYSCSVQTAVGDSAVHNTANATGTGSQLGGVVTATSSADTTLAQPAPPAQLVLPERVTPGTAKLLAPTGCAAKAFNARVKGTKIATVVFLLDGKVVKRFKKPLTSGNYALRIDPAKLRIGVHRLVVNVTFQSGTGTKPKTIRLSFQRCTKKLAQPRFTG